MAAKKKQSLIHTFISNNKQYPIIAAISAGLYPILFYFTNNYTIVNTWSHVGFFVLYFLVLPIVLFVILNYIFKFSVLKRFHKYVIPFLNIFAFLMFMMVCYYAGIKYKIAALCFLTAIIFSVFFYKFFKKIIIIQLILASIGIYTLTPRLVKLYNHSDEWTSQIDNVLDVEFKRKPNVYFIQPDGYANFSELRKENYKVDYSKFEEFLMKENFKYYEGFRSNYPSTLSSNSATFMMKHHYYNNGTSISESLNARNIIITENAVLSIFKNNNYKTYFLAELPYLILNKPKIGYDESNFSLNDVSYIGTGLGERQDIINPLKKYLNEDNEKSKFFFIEIFNPGHIHGRKVDSEGVEGERKLWIESLNNANERLYDVITLIKEKDPNSLIVIMADHGGFVGMENTYQIYNKTQNKDIINSIFTSTLAIHWPNNNAPNYDTSFKSAVNVFRILFSYLGEDDSYLKNLQPDESFVILKDVEPPGVYKYIDQFGTVTLKKQ